MSDQATVKRSYLRTNTRRSLLTASAALALSAQAALAATFNPTTSSQLSTALSQAQLGDTIILQAGTIYEGTFTLPNRTTGSGYITIQSSNLSSLPAAGTRVSLSDATNMPRIRATDAFGAAFQTATSAHHFKLIGLEITGPTVDAQPDGISNITWAPIELGTSGTAQDTLAEVPHNIIIDRCIVRANSTSQRIKRGIGLNSASTDITNCYIDDFKAVGQDSQAIGGYNGPGPFNIINNYIEGSTENLLFGGTDASITSLVPTDIVIKRNYFTKPMTWKGSQWSVKNIFELKNARNVLVEGNIFEHCWISGQSGYGIVFTPRNQNGGNPWVVLENITFSKNIVRKTGSVFNILGDDDLATTQQTNNLTIENNLIYDVGVGDYTGSGWLILLQRPTDAITFNHNTAFFPGQVIETSGVHTNFVYTNNLTPHNLYGIRSSIYAAGNATLNNLYPGVTFTRNVLKGGTASWYNQYPQGFSSASVAFPSTWTGVLEDQANPGATFAGWKVEASSEYDGGGTDGQDVGCNIDEVVAATEGCITGVWSGGSGGGGDIVVYASEAHKLVGTWTVTSDATAAGGSRIGQPNAGAPKVTTPAASPGNYFEVSFQAQANTPYHIWVRGKALNNDWANDSAYAQFDNSVTSTGTAQWRIGTTSGTPIFLEEGSGAGLDEWGWNDNDYNTLGENVYFSKSGTQVMRVQQREDGYQIDQIVLSPTTYLTTRPGALKNDTTILTEAGTNPVDVVLHAKNAPTKVGTWTNTTDATAASGARIGQPNAGVPKINTPAASPANYFEMSFFAYANTPYHIWFRGKALNDDWANDSAYAQFNNSTTSGGTATWRIGTTSGTPIFLEEGSGAGLSNWGWNDNDYNALGTDVYFSTTGVQTIRVQQREDGYQIDQIVLSPTTYLTTRPGALKNDTTILAEQQ